MKKVNARLYCLAVPSNLYSEILYMMILQKILKKWRHPHKIIEEEEEEEEEEESITSQFRQNGPLYPESFTESGLVKALTDSGIKVALLEGRWDSADLFAYSFPLRFEYKF